jgi:hypothetical protein
VSTAQVVEAEAQKPGPLRMFKATASNTFRPHQIKAIARGSLLASLCALSHPLPNLG